VPACKEFMGITWLTWCRSWPIRLRVSPAVALSECDLVRFICCAILPALTQCLQGKWPWRLRYCVSLPQNYQTNRNYVLWKFNLAVRNSGHILQCTHAWSEIIILWLIPWNWALFSEATSFTAS
jgi:hypothetical protein